MLIIADAVMFVLKVMVMLNAHGGFWHGEEEVRQGWSLNKKANTNRMCQQMDSPTHAFTTRFQLLDSTVVGCHVEGFVCLHFSFM